MIFNEQHKVIISSLNKDEVNAFIKFLQSEIIRHGDDIKQAKALIKLVRRRRCNDNKIDGGN